MFKPQFNILPEGARAGGLLPWIVAVMMYLCGLVLFIALAVQGSVSSWSGNLDRSYTVQLLADSSGLGPGAIDVADILRKIDGVSEVSVLTQAENAKLLETWLGDGNVTEDLPVPSLLDVTIAPGADIDRSQLQDALKGIDNAQIDASARWLGEVKRAAVAVIGNAYVILAIVLAATIAIVIFGTRAQLAAHEQTVVIVHHMGADDAVIAREFEYSFLRLGLLGGAVGLALTVITLIILSAFLGDSEAGLLSILRGRWALVFVLVPLPLLAGAMTMLTARYTVLRTLTAVL